MQWENRIRKAGTQEKTMDWLMISGLAMASSLIWRGLCCNGGRGPSKYPTRASGSRMPGMRK
jgi:hypothetical protein